MGIKQRAKSIKSAYGPLQALGRDPTSLEFDSITSPTRAALDGKPARAFSAQHDRAPAGHVALEHEHARLSLDPDQGAGGDQDGARLGQRRGARVVLLDKNHPRAKLGS